MPRADPTERLRKLEKSAARIRAELQRVKGRAAQEARKRDTFVPQDFGRGDCGSRAARGVFRSD